VHAVLLREFGPAGNLRLEDVPDPLERPGCTVVQLHAAALNWHDVLVRQGRYGSPLPHIIGADGAGVRRDTGEAVVILPSLYWGEDESAPSAAWEILGDHRPGTYAELVSVPTDCLLPKPRGFGWTEAAALPLVGVTTYRALFTRGRLKQGESVLVLGAGGGVATAAVALAAGIGATVVVTSSSAGTIDRARAHGAADGVLYTDADWPEQARRLSPGGRGFDVVLDSVGSWAESIRALRPGGRLVVLGASRAELAAIDVRPFYFGQYDILGTTMGSRADLVSLLDLLDSASIALPIIDRVFPLDEAAAAHDYLETGRCFGKVALSIA
jgi:NADPH:quinone reductase-like Zn-dependent oxidoreductase